MVFVILDGDVWALHPKSFLGQSNCKVYSLNGIYHIMRKRKPKIKVSKINFQKSNVLSKQGNKPDITAVFFIPDISA